MQPDVAHVEHDGLRIGILDWGGAGPPLVLLHPNGFCAGVFDPIAQRLRGDYRPIGIDVRGHGTSDAPADRAQCTFFHAATDVLAALDALDITDALVLGESLGGAAAILLDELRPGIVRTALLCEAIAMPPRDPEEAGRSANPMVEGALRRRVVWPDRATVVSSYGARPPLNAFEPAALEGYVHWGFRDRPDGQVELSCPPSIEARFFEGGTDPNGAPRAFAHLPSLTAPVTIVCGNGTNLPDGLFPAQAAAAGVPLHTVAGTHFFLQEDSDRAAELVRRYLPV